MIIQFADAFHVIGKLQAVEVGEVAAVDVMPRVVAVKNSLEGKHHIVGIHFTSGSKPVGFLKRNIATQVEAIGRAVAFMMDDALLAGERAKAKKPDNWEIVGKPQSQEAYGCMLRKDDPQFKKLMDDTIAQVQTSGEAEKWFDKWFKNPIPPKNLNMNFELSDEMKALFKEPNDKALN